MSQSNEQFEEWLRAARAGSREAVGQVLERFRRYLILVARKEIDPDMQPKAGGSDLVQETFLEANKDFATFQGQSEAELLAWLRQVLLHNLANFHRRYRDTAKRNLANEVVPGAHDVSGEVEGGTAGMTASPGDRLMEQEELKLVQSAIAKLSEDHRRVINYWYEEELTFEEIGQRMGRSRNAVRMLWVRAIEKLQTELKSSD